MIAECYVVYDPDPPVCDEMAFIDFDDGLEYIKEIFAHYMSMGDSNECWPEDIGDLSLYRIEVGRDKKGDLIERLTKVVECRKVNGIDRPPKNCEGWENEFCHKDSGYWDPKWAYKCNYRLTIVNGGGISEHKN